MARLWAFMMSLMSPVSPMENSVMGMSSEFPPPAAVPLTFMVGPPDGWRKQPPTFTLRFPRPSIRPQEVVLFPSPRGVGVMAVTSIYLPSGRSLRRSMIFKKSSLHSLPMGRISSFCRPKLLPHLLGSGHIFLSCFRNLPIFHLNGIVRHVFLHLRVVVFFPKSPDSTSQIWLCDHPPLSRAGWQKIIWVLLQCGIAEQVGSKLEKSL